MILLQPQGKMIIYARIALGGILPNQGVGHCMQWAGAMVLINLIRN